MAEVLEEQEQPCTRLSIVRKVKKKDSKVASYGRSVSIKPDTYAELKTLLFWTSRENPLDGSTMDALFKALIQSYCEKNPAAKVFVSKNS